MKVPKYENHLALQAQLRYSLQLRHMLVAIMAATFGLWTVIWHASTTLRGEHVLSLHGMYREQPTGILLTTYWQVV